MEMTTTNAAPKPFKLIRKADKTFIRFDGETEERAVRVMWCRPITGKGKEISLLDEKKKEVLLLNGLDAFDAESRVIAEDELRQRYLNSKITRVYSTHSMLGTRYVRVDTERGERQFVIKSVNKDVTWISDDHIVIRDTLGNRFEIVSIQALDAGSKVELERIL
jgi:hypothetical protein